MSKILQHIPFTKMQGAGNDFVILDNRSLRLSKEDIADLAPAICDRKFGVGGDGIMALLPPEMEKADYTMFYLNPDGSNAGMCGNGGRCMALFASSLGFESQHSFNVHSQLYKAKVENDYVRLSFPMQATVKSLTVDNQQLYFTHTGTEHVVTTVDREVLCDEQLLREKGKELRHHKRFQPKGTNANFIFGVHTDHVELQTFERGVEDLTLACGTGAIASALVWHHIQKETFAGDSRFTVKTTGGQLEVYFTFEAETKSYHHIKLQGPAHFVFEGKYKR